jgi:hypothetical protein
MDLVTKKERGSAYYRARLENEHPAICAELDAGKYKSLREACVAAGLRKDDRPIGTALRAWSKATPPERLEILKALIAKATDEGIVPRRSVSSTAKGSSAPRPAYFVDRRFTPEGKKAYESALVASGMKPVEVLRELGLSHLDPSIGLALKNGTRLNEITLKLLDGWIRKHVPVSA